MRLSQEQIRRMIDGRGGSGGGGGGSLDPALLAGMASQAWVEEGYISKAFFNELFIIHKKVTTVVMDGETEVSRTVITNTVFEPNEIPSTTSETDLITGYVTTITTEVDNIEAKKGFWTNYFLSALGLNSSGGGGGGSITIDDALSLTSENAVQNKVITADIQQASSQTCIDIVNELVGGGGGTTLNQPLSAINSAGLGTPSQSGVAIIWNGSAWIYQVPSGGGGQSGTKVYLAQNSGSLTSEMLTSQNVVYVISYDYTIASGTTVTVPSGCTLEFAGGSINGGTLALNNTYLYGNVKFGSGVTITGSCKNETAYQNWFVNNNVDAWHRFINNVDGPGCYEYVFGAYQPTVYVSKQLDNKSSVVFNGNNAVLTFTYTQSAKAFAVMPKNAETYSTTNITNLVYKGDTSISVADASIFNVGDIIAIRDITDCSFSPFRLDYRQCEFVTIIGISGSVLTLANPVFGQYVNSGSLKATLFNTISCHINDLVLKVSNPASVPAAFTGVEISQSIGGGISNVKAYGFKTCIRLFYGMRLMIDGCTAHVTTDQGNTDSYGLSIANCQNVNVIGGEYMGGNHGVSIGGGSSDIAAICREILVKNVRARSIRSGFVNAIDMHGNSEFITIEGCTTAGIYMRGRNNNVLNNFVYDSDISCGELENYNHNIRGNILKKARIAIAADTLRGSWVHDSVEDNFVVKDNKTFDCPSIPSSYTGTGTVKPELRMFITSSIDSTYYNIDNTKIIIDGNEIHNGVLNVTGFNTIIISNNVFDYDSDMNSSVRSKPKLTCTNLFVDGNKFINYGHDVWYIGSSNYEAETKTWSYNNVSASKIHIKNNYSSTDSSIISKPLFEATTSAISELFIEGNVSDSLLVLCDKTISKAFIRNNTFSHYYVRPSDSHVYFQGININPGENVYSIDTCIVTDNLVASGSSNNTNALIIYAKNIAYGRNIRLDTMALTVPKIQSNTTGCIITNLDA